MNCASREQLADYLTLNDFRVTPAENGRQMMEILNDEAVDLVALDFALRGEDGNQLARRLREISRIPIIIVTSRTEEADRVMGLELGADDYVNKPFSTRELLARIRAVMRRYRTTESAPDGDRAVGYRFCASVTIVHSSQKMDVRTQKPARIGEVAATQIAAARGRSK